MAAVSRLAGNEREATAALIIHLGELDVRRLYEGAGFPSLFQYCVTVLHLSEGATYNRIETARAARRFPAIGAAAATPVPVSASASAAGADRPGGECGPAAGAESEAPFGSFGRPAPRRPVRPLSAQRYEFRF